MRARVLITDGSRTIDLYWVEHTGTDVYCGTPNVDGKRSYHASGKIHSTREAKREHEAQHTPLKDLKGQFSLTFALGVRIVITTLPYPYRRPATDTVVHHQRMVSKQHRASRAPNSESNTQTTSLSCHKY